MIQKTQIDEILAELTAKRDRAVDARDKHQSIADHYRTIARNYTGQIGLIQQLEQLLADLEQREDG